MEYYNIIYSDYGILNIICQFLRRLKQWILMLKKKLKIFTVILLKKFKKIHTVHVLAVKRFHERKEIMDFLLAKKIGGIVFLSANKGYGEITRLVRAGAYPIVDATTAPLTNRPAAEIEELNYFRMPGSGITKRAFLQVKIDGTENERAISFTFIDSKGKPLFSTSIKEAELYKFE